MNNNVKFWHSLKVKPRFLILLINLKTEQDNEGWKSGGKGAQNYRRRENVVREVDIGHCADEALYKPSSTQ